MTRGWTLLLLAIAVAALACLPFVAEKFYVQFATRVLIMGIFAMSLDLLVGHAGLVSLGHAAFFGFAGYSLALLSPRDNVLAATSGLPRGYATAQTDGGHPETTSADPGWVKDNPAAVTDFSYRAIHETAVLGKAVVAEGVESAAQLDFLREQRCDLAQGYFMARPLTAQDMTAMLLGRGAARGGDRSAAGG